MGFGKGFVPLCWFLEDEKQRKWIWQHCERSVKHFFIATNAIMVETQSLDVSNSTCLLLNIYVVLNVSNS